MNFKRTIVIAVIFLLLGGFYYFYEIKGKPIREKKERAKKGVFSIDVDHLKTLTIEREDKKISFEKKDENKWNIVSPVEAKADEGILNYLARTLAKSEKEEIVEEKPNNLNKYGLSPPQFTVTISDGKKSETLLIGDKSIDGDYFYAKRQNSPQVFLITSSFGPNLSKNVTQFREKRIMDITSDKITKVAYTVKGENFLFEKKGKQWTVKYPVIPHWGSSEIEDFVDSLITIRAEEFFKKTPENIAKYGIDKPIVTAEIYGKDPNRPITLIVGKPNRKEKYLFVTLKDSKEIYGLSPYILRRLEKKKSDFIGRTLLNINSDKIFTLIGKIDGTDYLFKKEKAEKKKKKDFAIGQWVRIKPDKASMKNMITTLSSLVNLYVKDAFLPEKGKEYGFKNSDITLKGLGKDGKELFTVTFGAVAKEYNEKDKVYIYAKLKGEDAILVVDKKAVEGIKKDLQASPTPEDEKSKDVNN